LNQNTAISIHDSAGIPVDDDDGPSGMGDRGNIPIADQSAHP